MRFRRAVSYVVGGQGLVFLMTLANSVLVTRALGPAARGELTLITTSATVMALVCGLGSKWAVTYQVGRRELSGRTAVVRGMRLSAAVLVGLALVGPLLPENVVATVYGSKDTVLYLASAAIAATAIAGDSVTASLLGQQQFSVYSRLLVGQQALTLGMGLLLVVVLNLSTQGAVGAQLSGPFLLAVYGLWHFAGSNQVAAPFEAPWSSTVRIGVRALAVNLLGLLLLRADTYMISNYLGTSAVGYYGVAVAVCELLLRVPTVVGTVLFPKVSAASQQEQRQLVAATTRTMALLMIVGGLALWLTGRFLVTTMYGREFEAAVPAMLWLLPGVVVWGITVPLSNYLAGIGYPWGYSAGHFVGLIVNVTLNAIWLPRYGIVGAAMATTFAYAINCATICWVAYRHLKDDRKTMLEKVAGD